jgi:hypothetical protein
VSTPNQGSSTTAAAPKRGRRKQEPAKGLADDLTDRARDQALNAVAKTRDAVTTLLDAAEERLRKRVAADRDNWLDIAATVETIKDGLYAQRHPTFEKWVEAEPVAGLGRTQVYAILRCLKVHRALEERGAERLPSKSHYELVARRPKETWADVAKTIHGMSAHDARDHLRGGADDVPEEVRLLERILDQCERLAVGEAFTALVETKRTALVARINRASETLDDARKALESKRSA